MELQHPSHEHPLILYEEHEKFHDRCEACGKGIIGPAYKCDKKFCFFFHLHKMCAELPEKTEHPMHPQHPLILHIDTSYADCNLCRGSWNKFTYQCNNCEFNLCISCDLEEAERRIEHKSHQHPLDFLQRPVSFHCDACNTESKDTSYLCTACPFWIHKGCASLPSTIKIIGHHHPLTLAYSLPVEYSKFKHTCQICSCKVKPTYWVYYCVGCRYYFAHVNCAKSKMEPERLSGSENEIKAKEDLDPNLIHLPALPDKYVDLISHFPKKFNLGENESATEVNQFSDDQLNHFSHDHPLILSGIQGTEEMKKDEILCDGCVLPISLSAPFYSCAQCTSFFLHKCCVELPKRVSHPFHTEHPLFLHGKGPDISDYFTCGLCNIPCNGFSYNCAPCNIYLDVKCASLLGTIKHEAHESHPIQFKSDALPDISTAGLLSYFGQYVKKIFSPSTLCKACGKYFSGFSIRCETCDFSLCNDHCAMLPRTVRHRYDPHALYLSYPPFQDHPDEFFCEICEEEIDPKLWIYHCHDCDQSLHTKCIYKVEETLNFKFGETFKARNHPHLLTVVQEAKRQSWCDRCNQYFDYKPAFECVPCNTMVCIRCTFYGDF